MESTIPGGITFREAVFLFGMSGTVGWGSQDNGVG